MSENSLNSLTWYLSYVNFLSSFFSKIVTIKTINATEIVNLKTIQSSAAGGWVRAGSGAGGREFCQIIMPLRGSILQAETCQIPSLAENPRWSRVWQ